MFPKLASCQIIDHDTHPHTAFGTVVHKMEGHLLAGDTRRCDHIEQERFQSLNHLEGECPHGRVILDIPYPELRCMFARLKCRDRKLHDTSPLFARKQFVITVQVITQDSRFVYYQHHVMPDTASRDIHSTLIP